MMSEAPVVNPAGVETRKQVTGDRLQATGYRQRKAHAVAGLFPRFGPQGLEEDRPPRAVRTEAPSMAASFCVLSSVSARSAAIQPDLWMRRSQKAASRTSLAATPILWTKSSLLSAPRASS